MPCKIGVKHSVGRRLKFISSYSKWYNSYRALVNAVKSIMMVANLRKETATKKKRNFVMESFNGWMHIRRKIEPKIGSTELGKWC